MRLFNLKNTKEEMDPAWTGIVLNPQYIITSWGLPGISYTKLKLSHESDYLSSTQQMQIILTPIRRC